MKSSPLLPAVTTLALLFTLAVSTATAGTAGNGWSQPAGQNVPKITVTAVDAAAGTIEFQMKDKSTKSLKIDEKTHVMLNGNPVKIDQIQAGMEVSNFVQRDSQTVGRIILYSAPTPATPQQ
jgi:hypothetical protein